MNILIGSGIIQMLIKSITSRIVTQNKSGYICTVRALLKQRGKIINARITIANK
jgi:hypothetical protein